MKRIFFLLFALIGGPVMIVSGVRDYQNSKKLVAEGKAITGTVVDAIETVSRRSRIHHYYLVVRFQPETGEAVQKKSSVSKDLFTQGLATQTAPVTYLPSNPKVFQVGSKAETQTSGIIVGTLLFLGGLGFVAFLWVSHRNDSSSEVNTLQQEPLDKAA